MMTEAGAFRPPVRIWHVDLGQQDAAEARLGPVAGGLARRNRALYEMDALGDATCFNQRNSARTFEHTVERA